MFLMLSIILTGLSKIRCRIYVRGDRWIDLLQSKTYAVTRFESIKTILSIAAELDLEIASFDIRTAFLHLKAGRNCLHAPSC